MKFLLALSWKNLSRYTKRTLITASAIAFGLGLFLFIDSMLIGAEKDSERNLIWYETGSLRIYNEENLDDWKKLSLKNLVDDSESVLSGLQNAGLSATPRVAFTGEMVVYRDPFPEDGSIQVRIFAIDAQTDADVYRLPDTLTEESSWIEPGSNQVILGTWMAEDLGADIGFPITIVARTRDGAIQTLDLEVVGLIKTPNPVINRGTLFMDLEFADVMMGLHGGVSQIDIAYPVNTTAADKIPEVSAALPDNGRGLAVVDWRTLASDYLSLSAAKRSGSGTILFLVFIIALVGISNTMLLAMYERRRELGMMRAMGMKDFEIGLSFMFEAAGIGVIGGAFGMLLGAGMVFFLVQWGINFEFIIRDMDIGYRISSVFRGIWRPGMFAAAFGIAIIMSMLVAFIPTRQALKMKITDCLRADS